MTIGRRGFVRGLGSRGPWSWARESRCAQVLLHPETVGNPYKQSSGPRLEKSPRFRTLLTAVQIKCRRLLLGPAFFVWLDEPPFSVDRTRGDGHFDGSHFPARFSNSGIEEADVVFLGMATTEEQPDYASYYGKLQERTNGLPPTVFVLAAEDISFREVPT